MRLDVATEGRLNWGKQKGTERTRMTVVCGSDGDLKLGCIFSLLMYNEMEYKL